MLWRIREESSMRILLVCSILLLSGCGAKPEAAAPDATDTGTAFTPPPAPPESFPLVLTEEVEYYKTGPQQGQPPDGKFAAGTKVNVRRRTGSYSLVRTSDGVEGYVSSDAISEPAGAAGTAPAP
jgi:hypothetical protein